MKKKAGSNSSKAPAVQGEAEIAGERDIGVLTVAADTMRLEDVVNPNRQNQANADVFIVLNDNPPNGVATEREVASTERIYDGDVILAEASASASVVANNTDNPPVVVTLVSFANAGPASVEVNWDEVTSVDEYYSEDGYLYQITNSAAEDTFILG